MRRAIYSNRPDAWKRICDHPDICIAPRRLIKIIHASTNTPVVATEDLAKTPTWLWLNDAVTEGTALLYWRVSSYKFDSDKARRLARLASISRNVYLVDVTPFCGGIETIYGTWRYIDRGIIGYQHQYAFAGDHAEMHNGEVVPSLDPGLNAWKIAPHCILERSPIRRNRRIVDCSYDKKEHDAYQQKRETLFATKKTPQPILTALADTVHAFETRRDAVLAEAVPGSMIIVNLDSYAKWYRAHGMESSTYAKPADVSQCQSIVFAEPPIIYPFRRIHIEAQAPDDCKVVDVRGDAKVDTFLGDRTDKETGGIDQFCKLLSEEHANLSNR